jgi:hypothetical protein
VVNPVGLIPRPTSAGSVDRMSSGPRPQPRRPGTDHGQVECRIPHVDDRPERRGDLSVGRIGQHRLAHHLDNRIRHTRSRHVRDRSTDRRVRRVHTGRNTDALQDLANLTDAPPIDIAHNLHRLDGRRGRPRPIAEILGDRTVELLVAGAGRLGQDGVGEAQRDGARHRRHLIGSQAPIEQQDAFSGRRHAADPRQHLDAVKRTQGEVGEHHRNRVAPRPQLAQAGQRLIATVR